jgi:hypothetical protein
MLEDCRQVTKDTKTAGHIQLYGGVFSCPAVDGLAQIK